MTDTALAIVVLAAGKGTRMRSDLPKVMHQLAGRPMIAHLLDTAAELSPERVVVVVGPDMDVVADAVAPHPTCVQADRDGTGGAVKAARDALEGFTGTVLVLYGDTPLVTADTMRRAAVACANGAAVSVLGFRPSHFHQYGRLITDGDGALTAIVEARDATPEELNVNLCNSGVMAFDGRHLFGLLDKIGTDNSKGEYYLTDMVALARADGHAAAVVEGEEDELLGVNARTDLAMAEAVVQDALRARAMEDGATLVDPGTVWFHHDTQLGRDVVVQPNVVFGPGVRVADGVNIRAFSHLEGADVSSGAVIGPYARLRPGAKIGARARVGNFVEIKNADLGEGAKVNHLSYVGDAHVGAGANIGAGTITCNYDGFGKYETNIGEGAFIGSNSALVAPVTVGDGAIVAAGSTISADVEPDALSIERAEQVTKTGWAARFRKLKSKG
ncbi:MAG: bifunctional UDP-N-acetylglucosamine diphosphorylase/glucosamine-1-phosphate N-acetyltransferase GlmU [Rhodospirillaceae bacterium]|jgi:bifunctional UDP-N-acetylglucosamine pyrophosphorylase / glucosamine-1-phosphate N-acetyltransferase|nr:bifunctional UDP-N-acetylglucosamine diphosphorylase/glucosamine-1-phosphate N-acetyltransferase GlmU [Rhodospirillaceae bacterium]MBT5944549.1 bifunctional UDP-N-acetylglucosamine diphosphorylase/glucosamine-1-phosphate N-acetyltransferase GlmU [Rhodospirillaceae bacterium]MBT6404297.1 bifunctional UDP-N-acetylglucosamine diphosphorylase/glucosamine-1-phosphate N-acetyltransferase GlmU [Rhodospirillaceae bacterium]MBT6535497.1 bifunctional UDP-N-acetylglucosamine diphosphorylase/glucosamine-